MDAVELHWIYKAERLIISSHGFRKYTKYNVLSTLICVKLQVCMWTSVSLVVPQATLGTAIGLVVSIMKTGNGVCNLIIGWILGPTSR